MCTAVIRCLFLASLISLGANNALALPEGFVVSRVLGDFDQPTALAAASDGRIFVAEGNGKIKLFQNIHDSQPSTLIDIGSQGYYDYIWSIILHPDFPQEPYLYLLHSTQLGNNSHTIRRLRIDNNQVSNWESSVIFQGGCVRHGHHGADMGFDQSGALIASLGDGSTHTFTDWDQDGQGICNDNWQEGGSVRAQNPHSAAGSLIRIDAVTGAAMPSNPMVGQAGNDFVIAKGLRNPFRLAINPVSGNLFVGDVGWERAEEINQVAAPLHSQVENFGWPCYEANEQPPAWVAQNIPLCQQLYASGSAAHAQPFYSYRHDADVPGVKQPSSITALAFYQGGNFPQKYQNAFFVGDHDNQWIKVMLADANGNPDPNQIEVFANQVGSIVFLHSAPDGSLFYVDYAGNRIMRIRDESAAPTKAQLSVTPRKTSPGTLITLDAGASTGNGLSYRWDLTGNGSYNDAQGASVITHFASVGTHFVSVEVTDIYGSTSVATEALLMTNDSPAAVIHEPQAGLTWRTGDVIAVDGSASNADGSPLPGENLLWRTRVFHCKPSDVNDCHTHPIQDFTGAVGSFETIEHPMPSRITVELVARGKTDYLWHWWQSDWDARRWIFFNNLQQNETLLDFPVSLTLTPSNFDYARAGAQGASVRFVAADGVTLLPFVIDNWNTGGESQVRVLVNAIAGNSANAHMFIYYDNAAAPSAQLTQLPATTPNPLTAGWQEALARQAAGSFSYFATEDVPAPLTGSQLITLEPDTRTLTLNADQAGLEVGLNTLIAPAPLSLEVIVNTPTTISGLEQQNLDGTTWLFSCWDDNDCAPLRSFTMPAEDLSIMAMHTERLCSHLYARMYLRGTHNNWGNTLMLSDSQCNWEALVEFSAPGEDRFKFDVRGTWTINYGDNNPTGDGYADISGGDIAITQGTGMYRIVFNDRSKSYTVSKIEGGNQPPTANAGANQQVVAGSSVQFDGSQSYDPDGQIISWQWSNGLTDANPSLLYTEPGEYEIELTVTDDKGATASDSILLQVEAAGLSSNYPQVYLRGTHNGWQNTLAMTLVDNHVWQQEVEFGSTTSERFKFDIYGNWSTNFGQQQSNCLTDCPAQISGNDITIHQGAGTYLIEFNDQTQRYTITPPEPVAPVFQQNYPQVYLRGSHNNWGTTAMQLVADHLWRATVTFGDTSSERCKFDIYGNWMTNFGDNNNDGIAETNGNDILIQQGAGNYVIEFNDQTRAYSRSKL